MINGLNTNEVLESRKKYGTNKLIETKRNSFFKLFMESLGDPIIKILIIALAIKILVLFKNFDLFETLGILISILVASLVSTISEYGSDAAFKKLESESSKIKVKVIRNKKLQEIDIEEVVVGDIVKITSGDKIPSDGKIIKGNIEIDESSINGESITKYKYKNEQVYRGTIVVNGDAYIKTEQVGLKTIYGNIAKELQITNEPSPLKLKLTKLAKTISRIGYIGAILVSISYLTDKLLIQNNFNTSLIINDLTNTKVMFTYLINALTLAVTIAIVSVPEGLPLMITLVLSSNMRKMLKDKVLVRKLVGIETSGNINYLLTDKTGTLTTGNLKVMNLYTSDNKIINRFNSITSKDYKKIIYNSLYYNNSSNYDNKGNPIGGNQTDKTLLKYIEQDFNINPKIIKFEPFDSKKKYSYVTLEDNKETCTYIKGAPEILISKCNKKMTTDNKEIYFNNKEEIINKLNEYSEKGYRIIALVKSNTFHLTNSITNLTFISLVIIQDEIRECSKESINILHEAGIKTIMITGDDKNTSKSIAKEINIIENDKDIVLTSEQLNRMSDQDILNDIDNIKVIARALPQDKLRIVNILKNANKVVAMTGDGINDAPALKKADVGFALGSGTEVSKEASDIVILDDNIKSITKAVIYGRTILKNIKKFIIYQLSINICAVTISIVGPLIGIETPITIVQMLWINLIMDTLAGIAFSFESPNINYMKEKPLSKETPIMDKYMKSQILLSGLYQAIICLLFLKLPIIREIIRQESNNKYLLTSYFTLFIFLGIFNSLNCRTRRKNIFKNITKNKPFIIIMTGVFLIQLFIIYYGGNTFRTYGLNIKELILVIIISLSIIPLDILRKCLIKNNM